MSKANRDTFCSCGSGKKYKKCCMIKDYPRFEKGHVSESKTDGSKQKVWARKNWENDGDVQASN